MNNENVSMRFNVVAFSSLNTSLILLLLRFACEQSAQMSERIIVSKKKTEKCSTDVRKRRH